MSKIIIFKRYDICRAINTGEFYLKSQDGKESYSLKATTWEEAEQEAYREYKAKLEKENPNCAIVIS